MARELKVLFAWYKKQTTQKRQEKKQCLAKKKTPTHPSFLSMGGTKTYAHVRPTHTLKCSTISLSGGTHYIATLLKPPSTTTSYPASDPQSPWGVKVNSCFCSITLTCNHLVCGVKRVGLSRAPGLWL